MKPTYPLLKLLIFILVTPNANAEDKNISFGGFVDTQYAFDFNAPSTGDRAFTTQPARHNEFNLNLGYLDMKYDTAKIRSRLALQAGTSVQANYAAEPTRGTVSGGDLSRHIQEARIGYKLGEKTWIDAGIFFSHTGAEGWVSKDNLVLSRSLVADYSPYYLSGVKVSHAATDQLNLLFMVTNGWQTISENNQDKTVGAGVEYSFDSFSLSYNTLAGNETSPALNATPSPSRFRHFHDFILKSRGLENWEWVAQYDMGFQKKVTESGFDQWQGALLMGRYKLNATQKISARAEYYKDSQKLIIVTNTPSAFNGYGGSLGYDQQLEDHVLWRLEARYLKTDQAVFPKKFAEFTDSNFTLTTSLSIVF